MLGEVGEYAVSAVGGLVSSASAVASAAALGAGGTVAPQVSGLAAILASLTSAAITVPFVAQNGKWVLQMQWACNGLQQLNQSSPACS